MNRQAFIAWLKQQKYAGKIQAGTPEALARLNACFDRLETHLATHWDGIDPAEMPLQALQQFPFDLKANDDGNLGSLFSYLDRPRPGALYGAGIGTEILWQQDLGFDFQGYARDEELSKGVAQG